jgi:uncharacterized membrane protein YbhN (UPF0104 family)
LKSAAIRIIPVVLAAIAVLVFWRELHGMSVAQFLAAVAQWSKTRAGVALALVSSSYLCLALNEQVGLRWAGARVKLTSGLAASFIAHALANNLGMGVLAGGALRAGVFARHGVSLVQVAKITAYGTVTFSLGVAALAGWSLLNAPGMVFAALNVSPVIGRSIGGLLAATPLFYIILCALAPDGMTAFGHEFRPPKPGIGLAQICFGMADVALSAALFWLLLGPASPPYSAFLAAYLISLTSGLVSGVPGGMGVFESVMLLLLPTVNSGVVAAALLGYRLFYYLAPLALALVLLPLDRRLHPSLAEEETQ